MLKDFAKIMLNCNVKNHVNQMGIQQDFGSCQAKKEKQIANFYKIDGRYHIETIVSKWKKISNMSWMLAI